MAPRPLKLTTLQELMDTPTWKLWLRDLRHGRIFLGIRYSLRRHFGLD